MDAMQQKIQDVVARLHTLLVECARSDPIYNSQMPVPHPPASDAEIAAYEQYLGRPLPKSYRAFLQLYNGYDWLAFLGPLLAIQDVMPGGAYYDEIKDWKLEAAEDGAGEVLDAIVIASRGGSQWVYLDPNKPSSDDELTVVRWDPDSSREFPDLVRFFESCIKLCEKALGR